jgi:hypothetical protein
MSKVMPLMTCARPKRFWMLRKETDAMGVVGISS